MSLGRGDPENSRVFRPDKPLQTGTVRGPAAAAAEDAPRQGWCIPKMSASERGVYACLRRFTFVPFTALTEFQPGRLIRADAAFRPHQREPTTLGCSAPSRVI